MLLMPMFVATTVMLTLILFNLFFAIWPIGEVFEKVHYLAEKAITSGFRSQQIAQKLKRSDNQTVHHEKKQEETARAPVPVVVISAKRQEINALYAKHCEFHGGQGYRVDKLVAKYGEDKLLSMVRRRFKLIKNQGCQTEEIHTSDLPVKKKMKQYHKVMEMRKRVEDELLFQRLLKEAEKEEERERRSRQRSLEANNRAKLDYIPKWVKNLSEEEKKKRGNYSM